MLDHNNAAVVHLTAFTMLHLADSGAASAITTSQPRIEDLDKNLHATSNVYDDIAKESPNIQQYGTYNNPNRTQFKVMSHARTGEVCTTVDAYFINEWPFHSTAEREDFLKQELNQWMCLVAPTAIGDRIIDASKFSTLFFLLDGTSRERSRGSDLLAKAGTLQT